MMKKLMDFLFKDEEVEEVSYEQPREEQARVRETVSSTRESAPKVKEQVPLPEEVKPVYIEKKEVKPVRKEPVEKNSNLAKMTLNEEKAVKPKRPSRVEVKEEYEFAPVISPMFGVLGDKNEPVKTQTVKKTSPVKNTLGTVISPFYGMEKPLENKVEEIEERLDTAKPSAEEEVEILNVSLDELISEQRECEQAQLPEHETEDTEGKTVVSPHNLSLFDDDLNS